jgi:hypothetical protein
LASSGSHQNSGNLLPRPMHPFKVLPFHLSWCFCSSVPPYPGPGGISALNLTSSVSWAERLLEIAKGLVDKGADIL